MKSLVCYHAKPYESRKNLHSLNRIFQCRYLVC